MRVEKNVPLQAYNTLRLAAQARTLVHVESAADALALSRLADWQTSAKLVLGGGSNIVLTGDVQALVLKVEIKGKRLVAQTPEAFIVEAGAGENWHDFVAWTLAQGYPGLENLALIPGTVGAAPVQNIGAYGLELQDRFDALEALDLQTGQLLTLNAAQCGFGYRESVFKHRLKNRSLITRVRFALPKNWQAVLGYADIDKKMREQDCHAPSAQQIFDWVCEIRRAKLPDPQHIGNVGSFFKNPTVSAQQCADLIARNPQLVQRRLADGRHRLAAAWLIEACGWRAKSLGQAGVHAQQALVLVNQGQASGTEVLALAAAIQASVQERFGVVLEIEPTVV